MSLQTENQVHQALLKTLEGHQRQILGTLTVEELYKVPHSVNHSQSKCTKTLCTAFVRGALYCRSGCSSSFTNKETPRVESSYFSKRTMESESPVPWLPPGIPGDIRLKCSTFATSIQWYTTSVCLTTRLFVNVAPRAPWPPTGRTVLPFRSACESIFRR